MPTPCWIALELKYKLTSKHDQDKIYDYCDTFWSKMPCDGFRFSRFSPPYLFPTELPWVAWPDNLINKNSKILSICGSGDVILYFLYKSAFNVVAVDISYHACMWNELKRQTIRNSTPKEIKQLYQSIVSGNLKCSRIFDKLYLAALENVSNRARRYWLSNLGKSLKLEFLRKFLRPTDTLFSEMIFYINNPSDHHKLTKRISFYPIYNLPIERFLEVLPAPSFDIIYLSNLGEYLRTESPFSAFSNLIHIAKRALVPGGTICLYESSRQKNIIKFYSKLKEDVEIREFIIRPRDGFVFRHCLVFITT